MVALANAWFEQRAAYFAALAVVGIDLHRLPLFSERLPKFLLGVDAKPSSYSSDTAKLFRFKLLGVLQIFGIVHCWITILQVAGLILVAQAETKCDRVEFG